MKGNQITLEDVENIRRELNGLESSYKAAFESTNNYKKLLDSKLKDSTKLKWELEHQTKRNNDYQKNLDKTTKNIAHLKYRLPKIGTSPWSFPEHTCLFFHSRRLQSVICPCFLSPQSWSVDSVCLTGFGSTQCATSSLLILWGIKRGYKPEIFASCMEVTWQSSTAQTNRWVSNIENSL